VCYQKYSSGFLYSRKKVPTIPKLLLTIKQKIHFPWDHKSLERVVKSLGYKRRRCQSQRKILMERADIVDWRSRYLLKIKEYWDKGCPVFYTDELWVDSNLTFCKCWYNKEVMGIQTNVNSVNRPIILYVGGINGFIPNAELIYRQGVQWGDYHGQMNAADFEKLAVKK
jgi:hypothetical protein